MRGNIIHHIKRSAYKHEIRSLSVYTSHITVHFGIRIRLTLVRLCAFRACSSYLIIPHSIDAAAWTLDLVETGDVSHPRRLAMTSSLDHSLYFYDHDFDHTDWMLYVMESPATGQGRGLVTCRIHDRNGKLCAVASQEGVIRTAAIPGPDAARGKL